MDEPAAESADALQIGTTGSSKTKADLLADGYTCTTMEGTIVTLCWKNGSPGYVHDRGTCTQNLTKSPTTYVAPAPAPAPTLYAQP